MKKSFSDSKKLPLRKSMENQREIIFWICPYLDKVLSTNQNIWVMTKLLHHVYFTYLELIYASKDEIQMSFLKKTALTQSLLPTGRTKISPQKEPNEWQIKQWNTIHFDNRTNNKKRSSKPHFYPSVPSKYKIIKRLNLIENIFSVYFNLTVENFCFGM